MEKRNKTRRQLQREKREEKPIISTGGLIVTGIAGLFYWVSQEDKARRRNNAAKRLEWIMEQEKYYS